MNTIEQTTQIEIERMIGFGMIKVSLPVLKAMVNDLGYKMIKDFDYINRANEITHHARSYGIRDKSTGLSFANVDSNKENLPALQKIRKNYFAVVQGKITEI